MQALFSDYSDQSPLKNRLKLYLNDFRRSRQTSQTRRQQRHQDKKIMKELVDEINHQLATCDFEPDRFQFSPSNYRPVKPIKLPEEIMNQSFARLTNHELRILSSALSND